MAWPHRHARQVHVLTDNALRQVHVLTDNAGMEIVSDLALAHYLLSAGKGWVGWVGRGVRAVSR
jgi:hypothetical protein